MKKQGCEIQALGINYTITKPKVENPFKIFSREPKQRHQTAAEELDELPKVGNPPEVRHVLKDINCEAKPWEILAIVGPSGAGKSSLLEILAGKLTPQDASIFVNQKPFDKSRFKKISGYVTQKDTLFPLLTVQETLMFTAKLRLRLPEAELKSRVKSLMEELGLSHVADARVGDDRVRGISGGEKRRVSIGVEVIHDPSVLLLDEPTSGLDSTSALQIIDMLKKMAETRGRTIILSIHQPGFRIVKLFNSILLLANGTVLHHGTVDKLSLRLRVMGLELPLHVNVVEFAIDSIEVIQEHQALQQEMQSRSFPMSFLGADAPREDSKGFSFEDNSDNESCSSHYNKILDWTRPSNCFSNILLCSSAKGGLNPYLVVPRFPLVTATNIIQASETQPQMGDLGGEYCLLQGCQMDQIICNKQFDIFCK
ncbi:unnamed protein product [Coffea canephora]|uniref:ABC transporter domain-containing protein n=1 Tax=Coffea canephora TaxID=49390 RepID=A0A068U8Z5_COFCA|nr:unnamed protein product [Coffea canephora]